MPSMFLLALIVGIIGAKPTASAAEILLRPSAWLFSSCQFTLSQVRRYSGRTSHRSWVSSSAACSPLLEGSPPHLTGYWDLSSVPAGPLVCLYWSKTPEIRSSKIYQAHAWYYDRCSCFQICRTVFPLGQCFLMFSRVFFPETSVYFFLGIRKDHRLVKTTSAPCSLV